VVAEIVSVASPQGTGDDHVEVKEEFVAMEGKHFSSGKNKRRG